MATMLAILIEYSASFIASVLSTMATCRLIIGIYKWQFAGSGVQPENDRNQNISSTVLINLLCLALTGISILPHSSYMLLTWSSQLANRSDATSIFWSALCCYCMMPTTTVSVLFLTVDRIIVVKFPMNYTDSKQQRFALLSAFGCLLCFLLNAWGLCRVLPFPAQPMKANTFPWLVRFAGLQVFSATKVVAGLLIVLGGGWLFHKIRKMRKEKLANSVFIMASEKQQQEKLLTADLITLLQVATVLAIDFIPQTVSLVLTTFFNVIPGRYAGEYNIALCSVDMALSVLVYSHTLRRFVARKKKTAVHAQQGNEARPRVSQLNMRISTNGP